MEVARRIEILDLLAECDQGIRDLRALGHGALLEGGGWSIEEAAGGLGRATNLVTAHTTDGGDLALELRRLRLEGGQRLDVGGDGGVDARGGGVIDLDGRSSLRRSDRRDRRRRLENQFISRSVSLGGDGHSEFFETSC